MPAFLIRILQEYDAIFSVSQIYQWIDYIPLGQIGQEQTPSLSGSMFWVWPIIILLASTASLGSLICPELKFEKITMSLGYVLMDKQLNGWSGFKRKTPRNFFLHFFAIHSSSRHGKRCSMLERIFGLFSCSRNIQCM